MNGRNCVDNLDLWLAKNKDPSDGVEYCNPGYSATSKVCEGCVGCIEKHIIESGWHDLTSYQKALAFIISGTGGSEKPKCKSKEDEDAVNKVLAWWDARPDLKR